MPGRTESVWNTDSSVGGISSPPRAAYVHIPFCAHKCGYCDFASLAGVDHLADRYLEAIELELRLVVREPAEVETLFVGGGTPTRLSSEQLGRLVQTLRRWFPLASGGEWTFEANPETVDKQKIDVLAEAGVNRISMGAQSFRPSVLRSLERDHDPEDVAKALELVRPRIGRWSIDLIFGAPGSTLEDWESDLDQALGLGPSHLSCYGLTYEKGTSLWKQWREGQVLAVNEEIERAMYAHTIDRLETVGLTQYEISNFSRPGEESRHNQVYWANESYFGIGVGAASYVGGVRTSNTRDLMGYLKRIESGDRAIGPVECLGPEARARETAVLMLRRTRAGLDRHDFERRTGYSIDLLAPEAIHRHIRRGWLEEDGSCIRLTREGLFVADSILSDFL